MHKTLKIPVESERLGEKGDRATGVRMGKKQGERGKALILRNDATNEIGDDATDASFLIQQRVFAVQLFELHRLIKVQKLIAASPDIQLLILSPTEIFERIHEGFHEIQNAIVSYC
ncbi:PREDICTED: uncharacterized protein LOC104757864 [Camelina sativa]|uniref:Uncharacterized protein LOC104757864 n=1 Tax=Camelina sativa TaxID=90675 RepID=A0ABM0X0T2_CAMSA|nr:PREDICTED: uncharacterized protein LOC104757864 [Camelina sativa]